LNDRQSLPKSKRSSAQFTVHGSRFTVHVSITIIALLPWQFLRSPFIFRLERLAVCRRAARCCCCCYWRPRRGFRVPFLLAPFFVTGPSDRRCTIMPPPSNGSESAPTLNYSF